MILNSARQTVEAYEAAGRQPDARCPDCNEMLVARMCEIKRSHFAHYPRKAGDRRDCVHEETEWHLSWKFAFYDLGCGWEIEYPLEACGKSYRADVWHPTGRRIREFVHSLSASYVAKHCDLAQESYDIMWLFDGHAFESRRLAPFTTRNGSPAIRHLLKPRARELADQLGSSHVMAHYDNKLWSMGNDSRYWFLSDTPASIALVKMWQKAHDMGSQGS
jgi:hypothetical protein